MESSLVEIKCVPRGHIDLWVVTFPGGHKLTFHSFRAAQTFCHCRGWRVVVVDDYQDKSA